jgi:hypothetical protein
LCSGGVHWHLNCAALVEFKCFEVLQLPFPNLSRPISSWFVLACTLLLICLLGKLLEAPSWQQHVVEPAQIS